MSSIVSSVKCNDKGKDNETTIEDFVSEVLMRLLQEKPKDPVSKLEVFSNLVKHGAFVPPKERSSYERLTNLYKPFMGIDDLLIFGKQEERTKNYLQLVNPPPKPTKTTGEDEPEDAPTDEPEDEELKMSDLLYEGSLFQSAGIGIRDIELFQVLVSMKTVLAANKKINSIRFFGKILGIEKNYYVLETEQAKDEPTDDGEQKKVEGIPSEVDGINKYTYYVSNTLGGNETTWIKLPDVSPDALSRSRKIKKFFTGNLTQEVLSHPPFKAYEIDLLRCQIARISHSTILAPCGRMKSKAEEDSEQQDKLPPNIMIAKEELAGVEKDEEFEEKLKSMDISKLDSWVHLQPAILSKYGRCTLFFSDEEKEKAEEYEEKKNTAERIPKPLCLASEENWVLHTYNQMIDNQVVCLSSKVWPGAHCVGYKRYEKDIVFSNIYIGHGFKGGDFTPQFILPVLGEYKDIILEQQVDPTIEDMKAFIPPPKKEGEAEESKDESADE